MVRERDNRHERDPEVGMHVSCIMRDMGCLKLRGELWGRSGMESSGRVSRYAGGQMGK